MAAADPAIATTPEAMSKPLGPLGKAAPPTPVCGAPEGSMLLVGDGLTDDDGVALADAESDGLAEWDGLAEADGLAEVDGLMDLDVLVNVLGVPEGAVALVV